MGLNRSRTKSSTGDEGYGARFEHFLGEDGKPVDLPQYCDLLYASVYVETTGANAGRCATVYYARSKHVGHALTLLDFDVAIYGDAQLSSIYERLVNLSQQCRTRAHRPVGCEHAGKDDPAKFTPNIMILQLELTAERGPNRRRSGTLQKGANLRESIRLEAILAGSRFGSISQIAVLVNRATLDCDIGPQRRQRLLEAQGSVDDDEIRRHQASPM
jgi:hypothetical protein